MEQETKWLYDLVDGMTAPLQGIDRQLGVTDSATQNLHDNINHVAESGEKIHGVGGAFGELGHEIIGAAAGFGLWTSFEAVLESVKEHIQEVFNVVKTMQSSQLVLSNLFGSSKEAKESEEMMHDVAANHAVDLEHLRTEYTSLVQKGFIPSQKELIKFADLAATAQKPIEDLMGAVESAGMGATRGMRQFGVVLKPVTGDLTHLTAKFHGHKTVIANNEEAIRSYVLSLADMPGVAGLSEKALDTLAGKEVTLKNVTEDMHTSLGDLFGSALPGWMDFKIEVVEGLTHFFEWLKQHGSDVQEVFEHVAIGVGFFTTAVYASEIAMTIAAVAQSAYNIGQLAFWVATNLSTVAQWGLNAALDANPIGVVIVLIGALVEMLMYAWNHSENFRVKLYALWEASKAVFSGIFDAIKLYFGAGFEIIKGFGETLLGIIMMPLDHGKMFNKGIDDMIDGTKRMLSIPDAIKKIGTDAGTAWALGEQEGHDSWDKSNGGKAGVALHPGDKDKDLVTTKTALGADSAGSASGSGSTSRNINVKIDTLGKITIQGAVTESMEKIRAMIHQELIGAVRDFEVAINNG